MGKMTLEELLNKLIEKGWKPFGYELLYPDVIEDCFDYDSRNKKCRFLIHKNFVDEVHNSLRELTSKESWLWQFLCENGMVKHIDKDRRHHNEWNLKDMVYFDDDYGYRLIESALCDEDNLEQFLLDNIKVE